MLRLLVTLSGFALVESLNMLNLGLTSAIVYDSRIHRRSPLAGGLSFIAGLLVAAVALGILVVLGVSWLTEVTVFQLTPKIRYRGELVIGVALLAAACCPAKANRISAGSALATARQRPWLIACCGAALGFVQAATDVMYLAALAMLGAYHPRPTMWPAIVVGYCAVALWPPTLVVFLATRKTPTARRLQRRLVRAISRYGPTWVRAPPPPPGLRCSSIHSCTAANSGDALGPQRRSCQPRARRRSSQNRA